MRKRILSAVLCLSVSSTGWGAVVRDANGTSPTEHTTTPGDSTKLTIGSISNGLLVVQIVDGQNSAVTAVTWDQGGTNQAAVLISSFTNSGAARSAEIWAVINPTSGNRTLRVAWTGANGVIVNGTSYSGVLQTGGSSTFPTIVRSSGTTTLGTTNAIASSAGNVTIGVYGVPGLPSAPTQTSLFLLSGAGTQDGAGSEATSGTATHSWTNGSLAWAATGIDIKAAPTVPILLTNDVSAISYTTATGNGNVTSDGSATVTERGGCWSVDAIPTTSNSCVTAAGTTGAYTYDITGVLEGTLYHTRSYAINSAGTGYGDDKIFMTYLRKPTTKTTKGTGSLSHSSGAGSMSIK